MRKLLTFITMLFMTVCMAIPAYAEETSPRRLDVQLVQVSLRDSGNQVHQNNLYDGSYMMVRVSF